MSGPPPPSAPCTPMTSSASLDPPSKRHQMDSSDSANPLTATAAASNSHLLASPFLQRLLSSTDSRGLIASTSALPALVENPTPQNGSIRTASAALGDRFVIVMVGLPARGKTYIARRLSQYLSFFHGANCQVFNVGSYRRERVGATKTPADWFRADNTSAVEIRKQLAEACMMDMKEWMSELTSDVRVAIYDATNTTLERRKWIVQECTPLVKSRSNVVFVESVVNDEALVENNVRAAKVSMPDYEGKTPEEAVKDFRARIEAYQSIYEPMGSGPEERHLSWVRVEDGGHFMAMNRIRGYLQGRICQFLSTLHTIQRPLYFSRHGQSEYNKLAKIGGDSALSPEGQDYAVELAKFTHETILGLNPDGSFKDPSNRTCVHARLYTSSLVRTKQTAAHIVHSECDDGWVIMRPRAWKNLDEIFAGDFDGMTYEEIQVASPDDFKDRTANKLAYRYPRGESYLDVIDRLEPVIMELERQREPVLIVAHQGVLRLLYAYFKGLPREDAPFVPIPLNTVIKLEPSVYSANEERFKLLDPPSHHEPNMPVSPEGVVSPSWSFFVTLDTDGPPSH